MHRGARADGVRLGNVTWPLKVAGLTRAQRQERCEETLDLLGIDGLADRHPSQLSGGQQQRVAIARTIASRPDLLLFDEPLSNLDAALRNEMRAELGRIHRVTGATTVYVTHDQVEALTLASHVALMRAGRVEQCGPPLDLLRSPANAFVAGFLGSPPLALLPVGDVADGRPESDGPPPGASVAAYAAERLRVSLGRPDDRSLTMASTYLEATPVAGRWLVTVKVRGHRVTAVQDERPDAAIGDEVVLALPAEPDHWL